MTQVIETDEAGRLVLSPELLRGAGPHQGFVIEANDDEYVLRPASATGASGGVPAVKLGPEEWLTQCSELAEEAGKVWNTDKSAAEIVSEMRR